MNLCWRLFVHIWIAIQATFTLFFVCNCGSAVVWKLQFLMSSIIWLCYTKAGWFQFSSLAPTFLRSAINLQGKWRSHFAKTKPHCNVGVICLEVSAEIKNLPTYSVCFKAISSPVITHWLWSVRAVRAFQESKAASEIWFINFIQC